MTHILAVDEQDAAFFNAASRPPALFWPSSIPGRFIVPTIEEPNKREAAFYGEVYGERASWVKHAELQKLMVHPPAAEVGTDLPQRFDVLHAAMLRRLAGGWQPSASDLAGYIREWRMLRETIFANWLSKLKPWTAIVNLPSLLQAYPGRVVEAMAAGRPVVSWAIPHRPLTGALFQNGCQILLFPKEDPRILAGHLRLLREDKSFARAIAVAAREELLRFHTAEYRFGEILKWIKITDASGCADVDGSSVLQIWRHDRQPASGGFQIGDDKTTRMQQEAQLNPTRGEEMAMIVDDYYTKLFVSDPGWSSPYPNQEEAARWCKIAGFLEHVVRYQERRGGGALRLLDVGCGRGWLTHLASRYGIAEGLDPVQAVVDHARQLFPAIRFHVGTPETFLTQSDRVPYDVVICSEVIEHVPYDRQEAFVASLGRLITAGGYLVLTTPRYEVREQWERIAKPCQPVEDWVTEAQVEQLLAAQGFTAVGLERLHVEVPPLRYLLAPTPHELQTKQLLPLYQVWLAQENSGRSAVCSLRSLPPKVSVIVPTYNRPQRLKAALGSVLSQTFQDFEIIVVNDGEESVELVVRELDRQCRITVINHDRNRGLAAARNTGIRMARGKYIAYLDDDDRYLPDHLETLVTVLEKGSYKAAYSDAWRVHERCEEGRYVEVGRDVPYSQEFSFPHLLVGNYFPVLCVMHERSCLDEVGCFDESLFAHEDWDLWIRMAEKFPFIHVKKVTAEFTWRTDGSSMTSSTRHTYYRTTDIIYRKYRPLAERFPGVPAAQERQLAGFKKQFQSDRFVCSIIIPVFNNLELTKQCLTTLAFATTGVDYEVILVDNGSTDGTASFLQTLQGDVRIIQNDENLGFAKACNQGAKAARGKYLVFLNNDTIPQPNWLGPLVQEVDEHPDVGIVGSKLLYPDGTIQHAGVVFMREGLGPYHIYQKMPADSPAVNRRREFKAVTAACLLIRRDLFEAVGGFDEAFVNGFEDVDLCLKVRRRGAQVVYQPRSVLYHLESQTPGRKTHDGVNGRLLRERWNNLLWLEDEDLHYHTDGYKLVGDHPGVNRATQVVPLADVRDRAAWAHVAAVQAAAIKKDWEAVRRELQLVNEWPNDRLVLSWGAKVAERLKESKSQVRFLARVVELGATSDEQIGLARLLLEQGNVVGAEQQLRAALRLEADHPEGLLLQGVLCMQREQYGEAELSFVRALKAGADRRKCLMGMGMAAMGRSYPQGAWEKFREVLADHPDDAEAIHWLLRAGTAQNRWEELSRCLEPYVKRNPGDLAVRFALAGVWLRADRVEEARREQEAIRALNPQFDGLAELEQAIARKEAMQTVSATEE